MRTLELLAPAKDLIGGKAAIDHGADAVYIGASRFGARAAAGNSVEDIEQLCIYAHQFDAKVYVTVNTILYDDEWLDTQDLLAQLKQVGVDAILVQDMSLVDNCPLPLHASTQTDNRTAEKVAWLHSLGFQRIVLARELSIDEIRTIHQKVPEVELEVFVHGALCVSYSGLCYASQYCFGRSANRGECAQFCRMKFDLVDADGTLIENQRHLLSLKDMNQFANIEKLAEAGACSFKIEGRLKDVTYVKNVTAAYSQQLNRLIANHPDLYRRVSKGRCVYQFEPDLNRTFNRGYTDYFAFGRQPDISSFDTPKAIGQYVGTVKSVKGTRAFSIEGKTELVNGDGLCFMNDRRQLEGFRVNRVESRHFSGHLELMLYPLKMPEALRPGMKLYRSQDQYFDQLLSKPTAERKIPITMALHETQEGFSLFIDGNEMAAISHPHEIAKSSQRENIGRQLTKLGDTPYTCSHVSMPDYFNFFIPSSRLAELRRLAIDAFSKRTRARINNIRCKDGVRVPTYSLSYLYNISNKRSESFYRSKGLENTENAFELKVPAHPLLMQCRYCLRYTLGYCVKNGGKHPQWHEPLSLQLSDGRKFPLEFDCRNCQMNVYAESR